MSGVELKYSNEQRRLSGKKITSDNLDAMSFSIALRLHGTNRSLTPSTNFDAVQPKLFRVARQDDYCFVIRTLGGAMSLFAYGAPILERDCPSPSATEFLKSRELGRLSHHNIAQRFSALAQSLRAVMSAFCPFLRPKRTL